jgi:hypothetical protein
VGGSGVVGAHPRHGQADLELLIALRGIEGGDS